MIAETRNFFFSFCNLTYFLHMLMQLMVQTHSSTPSCPHTCVTMLKCENHNSGHMDDCIANKLLFGEPYAVPTFCFIQIHWIRSTREWSRRGLIVGTSVKT